MPALIKQGEDKIVDVLITKNGVGVDVTAADNIISILFVNSIEQKRYQLTPTAGYGNLTLGLVPTNLIKLELVRDDTKTWPAGGCNLCTTVQFVDPSFDSGFRREEYTQTIGVIQEGCGLDEFN